MLQSRYNVFTIEVDEILIVIYAAILSMSAADCSVPVLNKMHVHESIIQMCITESLLADPIVVNNFLNFSINYFIIKCPMYPIDHRVYGHKISRSTIS